MQENRGRSRTENVKRIIAGGFVQQTVHQVLPFIGRTVMIYTLGSLYLGLNGLFASILQVLNLAELGFNEAMVFSMYKPLAEGDTPKVCALLNLYRKVCRTVGIAIGLIGLSLMPVLRHLISGEIPADINLYIIYLLTLANTCVDYLAFSYKRSLFTADQRSDVLSLITSGFSTLEFLVRMVVLIVFRSYYLYCIATPVVTFLKGLYTHRQSIRFYPEYVCRGEVEQTDLQQIRQKLLGLFVNRFSYVCRNSFDSVTLSAFMGLAVVTIFQNYFFILKAITKFSVLLSGSIVASVGNSIVMESQEKNYRDFRKFQLLFMWLVGWCTVCLMCLYQPFMRLWMGADRMLSTGQMTVFCVYYFTDMMSSLCYAYRQGAGLYQYRKFVPVLESAVNVGLNILLVRRFGVIGVLASTIFCQVFIDAGWSSGILFDYYFTEYKKSRYLLRLCGYGAVTMIACGVTWWVCSLVKMSDVWALMARMVICLVLPNGIFMGALRLFPEYGEAVQFVQAKLMRRKKI